MNLQTIKINYNRGCMTFEAMEWLMDSVSFLEEENSAMAEKHAEKDLAIRDLMQMNLQQKERIAQIENVKEMYLNANLVLLEQNERLMKEVELYKLQETKLIAQLKMMKNNSRLTNFYKMSEENLRLAEENVRLKSTTGHLKVPETDSIQDFVKHVQQAYKGLKIEIDKATKE